MTNRLPIPGSDDGDWGDILNSFLEVSLASDGTLNSGIVGTAQLDSPTQTTLASVASKYTLPSGGVPSTDMASDVQSNLTLGSTSVQPSTTLSGDLSGTLSSPTVARISGITLPSSSPTSGQVLQATSSSSTNWATVTSSGSVNNATTSAPGLIELSGDLGGTATSATSPVLASTANVQAIISANSSVAGSLQKTNNLSDLSSASTARTNLGLGSAATISSTAGGDLSGTLPSPTVAKIQGTNISTPTGGATSYLNATGSWTTPAGGGGSSNATSSTPGLVQLDGDLGGTATAPTVAKVNGITLPSSAPAVGNVLTATSASATSWTTPAAGVTLDSTVSDIQTDTVTGTAVVGTTGKAADAGHQHPLVAHAHTTANTGGQLNPTTSLSSTGTPSSTTFLRGDNSWSSVPAGTTTLAADTDVTLSSPANGQVLTYNTSSSKWVNLAAPTASNATTSTPGLIELSGDLGGTATAPTVAKVNGVAVTGTPSSGQVITASSTTAASWTTPAAGASGAQALVPTTVKTAAYTASPGDFVPVDASSGSITITLPTAPADKSRVEIKMINTAVNATNGYGNNYITFNTGSGDVLNKSSGSTSGYLTLLNQSIMLQYALSSAIWYVQSDDLPATSVVLGISHTVTTAYTLISSDHIVMADATSAAFTVTLPTAVGFNGRYTLDAVSAGTNIVTVATTSSQTIDGASTTTLGTQASGAIYSSVDLISDGANWRVI